MSGYSSFSDRKVFIGCCYFYLAVASVKVIVLIGSRWSRRRRRRADFGTEVGREYNVIEAGW